MENKFIDKINSRVLINVKGKNIDNFIKRLINHKIEILDLKYINHKEINIIVYKKDYEKIKEIKTIYSIILIRDYGKSFYKNLIKKNSVLFISIIICLGIIYFLSNIIFEIEIVYNDSETRKFIKKELSNYGITEKSFKKNFDELDKIKKQILEKNKDTIEWLEIEVSGIKYIVRLNLRKIKETKETYPEQNVIASKDAKIERIIAESGQIVKNINDYVKKGDIIISGNITLNEETKNTIAAKGTVYGEVWYNVSVEYPYIYYEEQETGKKKNVLTIKFLNKRFDLFNFNKFKDFKYKEEIILENKIIPFKLSLEHQKELNVISDVLTEEQAINKAIEKARMKMQSKLNDNEYIKYEKCLKVNVEDSKIKVEVFFTVYEDITSYQKIEKLESEE